MPQPEGHHADGGPEAVKRLFIDLREHNEYARRVAERVKAQRERHVVQVIQARRRQRLHQAR